MALFEPLFFEITTKNYNYLIGLRAQSPVKRCQRLHRLLRMTTIGSYQKTHRQELLDFSIRAWTSVFPALKQEVPAFVYECFYPDGWKPRQLADLAKVLDEEPDNIDVAFEEDKPVGWVCTRLHPEDSMGEIHVLVVDPDHQRQGIGQLLLKHSKQRVRSAGMSMLMVETVEDVGHAPARKLYELNGFEKWPVARYFLDLKA